MANSSEARYRSDDLHGRASNPGAPASDPLAELARLIGQDSTFNDYSREPRAAATVPPYQQHYQEAAPQAAETSYPADDYAAPQDFSARYEEEASQAQASEGHASEDRYAAPESYVEPQSYSAPYYEEQGHAAPEVHADRYYEEPAAAAYEPQAAADMNQSAYAEAPVYPSRAVPPGMAAAAQMPPLYLREPQAGAMPAPHGDDFYDDAPQSRRKGMLTVAAVLGLAVVGSAGAFGYRTVFSHSSTPSAPPIIRASAEPTKIAPPPSANSDAAANKLSYDRFGDRGQNEQVVSREEKPVDMRDVMRASPPPPLMPQGTSTASVGTNPPSVLTEPKRVRTVPIRPDQPEMAQRPQAVPAAPPRQSLASAMPSNVPLDVSPAARAPAPARPPQPVASAPLSISPQAGNPPPQAAAPTRVAALPSGQGHYLVQVSSQRSEADAQASFRSIKAKYASVLGNHPSLIRRADLGDKGTYYRAMVGPFPSREAAIQLCVSLKAAGGACVVQGN